MKKVWLDSLVSIGRVITSEHAKFTKPFNFPENWRSLEACDGGLFRPCRTGSSQRRVGLRQPVDRRDGRGEEVDRPRRRK